MIEKIKILDHAALNWIHTYLSNPILDRIMPFITNEDNWIIPILLLIIFLSAGAQKKGRITLCLLIVSLSLTDIICAQYIKPFIERVRPSHLDLEGINLLVKKVESGACLQIIQRICSLFQLSYHTSIIDLSLYSFLWHALSHFREFMSEFIFLVM